MSSAKYGNSLKVLFWEVEGADSGWRAEVPTTQAADYMTLLSAPTIVASETSVGEVAR
jgi:hypothetical protein